MPTPDLIWTYISAISTYLFVLMIPGLAIGWAGGLRGWTLTGLAPLLTYTSIGLAGPWLSTIGLPFNPATAAAVTLLLAGVVWGLRWFGLRRGWVGNPPKREPVVWTRRAHIAVACCVLIATAVSIIVVFSAAGGTNAVFQRWDTVFHANGIRYIAETGDGGLFGMSTINWYEPGQAQFYPNAYHLAGSLVYSLTDADIPTVLNAITVPIAGIFALSMVALVRQFGGRAVFAGCAAIVASAATTGAYESVSSGLLPFALGIVLTPLAAVALQHFLDRPGLDSGMIFALCAAGLLAAHSSTLFGAILFAFPLLIQRWIQREGKILPDLAKIIPAGVLSALLTAPHLLGAVSFSSGSYPYTPWASDISVSAALTQLVTFRQVLEQPQVWLAALLVVGALSAWTLRRMRWVVGSGVLFAGMFVLVACYGAAPWIVSMSRPWWNDRYRLMAMAAIPLCLLAAHGLAELQRWTSRAISSLDWVRSRPQQSAIVGLATAVLILAGLAVVTNGFYTKANATAVAFAYHNGPKSDEREPPVTKGEVEAMLQLRNFVHPGEKVLNDRVDGSAWMYAIAGVRPTAGHYDPGVPPRDARYLSNHFREFNTDPEVRAALDRLNVHNVLLGHGAIKSELTRAPGLRDLDGLNFLEPVYSNPDAVIYRIIR